LLRSLRLDAMVVVAYGLILPAGVLGIPRLGCLNIHASLLPRWRGAAPIQRAILAGDLSTGITIMRLEPGLDTGPTLARRETDIAAGDTAQSLHDRLATIGAELIDGVLRSLDAGAVREVPQPQEGVTYAEKIHKGEARIDWCGDAAQIWRQVRAFNSWPVAETQLNGAQLRVWDAEIAPAFPEAPPGTVLAATGDGIDVACGRGTLRVLRLQLAGRKPLAAREFLKAQPLTGTRFGL
jgi:methionyl-tRNA formyltransferase